MAGVYELWCPFPKTTQARSTIKILEDNLIDIEMTHT